MTPEQRAENIVFSIFHEPQLDHPEYERLIAAQIKEAVREAVQEAVEDDRASRCADDLYNGCYARGRAEAYEDAAKILDAEASRDAALVEKITALAIGLLMARE